MHINLYNTLSRSKEIFVPIKKWKVSLYSCGPTVYWDPHIWNMRQYFFVDLLKSVLIHIWWYEVDHIMNITDVWHLTDDWDHWEDKMEKWARRDNKSVRQVARMYEENFKKYAKELQISGPKKYTRATEYMQKQIDMIKVLTDKWFTYIIPQDGIYMDTSKVKDYGKLAQLDFNWMNSDHRVDGAKIDSSKKRNLSDFALRKFSPEWEKRAMEWVYTWSRSGYLIVSDSFDKEQFLRESDYRWSLDIVKWSDLTDEEFDTLGFPWRHIECSAMATAELGNHIDIHTWWVDHVTVHHTNEIVQAECSLGCEKRVNRWMHWQFLQIGGSKVSKSKWDDLSVAGIIAKGYSPMDLRYFYFTAHYRSFLDFTWEALDAAKKSRENLIKKLYQFTSTSAISTSNSQDLYLSSCQRLADDLDVVQLFKEINQSLKKWIDSNMLTSILKLDLEFLKVGLQDGINELTRKANSEIPKEITDLASAWKTHKSTKDYVAADRLRDDITTKGWKIFLDETWKVCLESL